MFQHLSQSILFVVTLSFTQVLVKLSNFQSTTSGRILRKTDTKHYNVSCRVRLDIVSGTAASVVGSQFYLFFLTFQVSLLAKLIFFLYFMMLHFVQLQSTVRTQTTYHVYISACLLHRFGDRGSTVVKVLCYKSEGRWFDPSCCQWGLR